MTTTAKFTDPTARRWGRAIRDQRKLLEMSQTELADKVGVTQGTVSKWEKGLAKPSPRLVPTIAKALLTAPSVLFAWGDAA